MNDQIIDEAIAKVDKRAAEIRELAFAFSNPRFNLKNNLQKCETQADVNAFLIMEIERLKGIFSELLGHVASGVEQTKPTDADRNDPFFMAKQMLGF